MSAYMVVFAKIHDRERFLKEYGEPTAALISQFGGEYLVRTPKIELLEGSYDLGNASVISKWPDRAAIDRFWHSPEYAPLKQARQALADVQIMVVEAP